MRDPSSPTLLHNLYSSKREDVIRDFSEQISFLSNRRGCNFLYHELLSIKNPGNLSDEQATAILLHLGEVYLQKRGRNLIGFCAVHLDPPRRPHLHIMLSPNEIGDETKRLSLSKKQFSSIQKEMERYVQETFPDIS